MSIPKSTPDRRVTRVMGVDPGLTRCGVGVVEGGLGSSLKLIAVGVIRTPADLDHAHRLLRIHDGLEEWRDHTRPDPRLSRTCAGPAIDPLADSR